MKPFSHQIRHFFSSQDPESFFWMFYLMFAFTFSLISTLTIVCLFLISLFLTKLFIKSQPPSTSKLIQCLMVVSIVAAGISFVSPFFHQHGWIMTPFVALQLFFSPDLNTYKTQNITLFAILGISRALLSLIIPMAILAPFLIFLLVLYRSLKKS